MNFAALNAHVDTLLREEVLPRSAAAGRPITCRGAGCFGCCKEPVQLSRAEAAYIVEGLTPEQREHAAAQTKRWLQLVQSSGMLQEPEPHVLLWRMIQAWCPLLRDGLCMAYDRRPHSCRVHLAIKAPENCHDDALRPRQKYAMCPELSMESAAEELEANGRVELDNLGVWLAELLLGKKIKSAARWTLRGHVEGQTLHLDYGDMPPLDKSATRVMAR